MDLISRKLFLSLGVGDRGSQSGGSQIQCPAQAVWVIWRMPGQARGDQGWGTEAVAQACWLRAWHALGGAEGLGPGLRHMKNPRAWESSQAEAVAGFSLLQATAQTRLCPRTAELRQAWGFSSSPDSLGPAPAAWVCSRGERSKPPQLIPLGDPEAAPT